MRYLVFILLLKSALLFSQSLSKQVISTAGSVFENENFNLSYSTGEFAVGSMTSEDGSIQLGNGYYPSLDLSTLHAENPELIFHVKVFPNPTTELIYISHPTEKSFDVSILDVSGKKIFQKIFQKDQPIDLKFLASGIYFIDINIKDSSQINRYKIIKK